MDASPNHEHPQVTRDHAYALMIRDARVRPFEWGVHDCVLFASAAVRIHSGRDALAEMGIEPTWRTALEAHAAIESVGGLRAAMTRLFGEPVSALQARAGDVALAQDPGSDRELLAVVHHGVLLAPSAAGLAVMSLEQVLAAWMVGP